MTTLKSTFTWARTHAWSLVLVSLPLILAACNKGGGGSGY